MSTRSRIGIQNTLGEIASIYCHHDGYVAGGVGEILVNCYKDKDTIMKLMELGDISTLGTEPVVNKKAWTSLKGGWTFDDWKKMNPENKCNTYRTRGEDVPASTVKTVEEYIKQGDACWAEYLYLFKDKKWYVYDDYDDGKWKLVKDLI